MADLIKDSRKGVSKDKTDAIENTSGPTKNLQSGIGESVKYEAFPLRNNTPAEKVWSGLNNAHIVLGKDRDDEPQTGYGGKGYGRSGMIHLVAGHYGAKLDEVEQDPKNPQVTNPNFNVDAAYIYISQRSETDKNLRLKDGSIGQVNDGSVVAIKADSIRIIGDRGIKIITRRTGKDSRNETIFNVAGIDLIAGNDDTDLQPLIKGNNAIASFEKISQIIDTFADIIQEVIKNHAEACTAIANHQHLTNVPGAPTLPGSTEVITINTRNNIIFTQYTLQKLDLLRKDISKYKGDFLEADGETYIASSYNNTN